MDAGPGLNFFASNQERLLFSVLGPLCMPEIVRGEMAQKSHSDKRFERAARVLNKLPERLLCVLSDDFSVQLVETLERISRSPAADRLRQAKDLGETMVVVHAVVAAESGEDVLVFIDDGYGANLAAIEARRLERLKAQGRSVGSIGLVGTCTVLERAAGGIYLPDKNALRSVYARFRKLDDGLIPLEQTGLLELCC